MAFHVYRYAATPVSVAFINGRIDPGFPASLVKQWNSSAVDLSADDSTKSDLDDLMGSMGWTFVGTDLPGPPKTVGGDSWRGRRNVMAAGTRKLSETPTAFTAAIASPRDLCIITPTVTWGAGAAAAGTYVAVLDSTITNRPVLVRNHTTGAAVSPLPIAPGNIGSAGWNRICYLGGAEVPTNEKLIVMDSATGVVQMIDIVAGTLVAGTATIPANGSHPYFDGGALYFVGGDGGLYMVNDPATAGLGTVVTVQPPGTFDTTCQYMVADEMFLYIPQPTSNRIARVGPNYFSAGAPVAFFTDFAGLASPQNPTGIAYDGRFLWVGCPGQASVAQLDPASPQLIGLRAQRAGNPGDGQHAVVFDGDSIWVSLPNVVNPALNGVSRIDPDRSYSVGNGELGHATGFNAATELCVRGTPGGAWVYVLSTGDNTVRFIRNEPFVA